MSSLPIQRSLAIEEEYFEKGITEDERKITKKVRKKNAKKLIEKLGVAAAPIPAVGQALNPALQIASVFIPEHDKLDGIRSEMNALNTRLDYISEELKWAYNQYQTAISNIENAWSKYSEIVGNQAMLDQIFFPFYTPDSALVIHRLLTSVAQTGSSSAQSLGDVLAKRFRCHEKNVEAQFSYLRKLLSNGNLMDEEYYKFKKVDTTYRKGKSKTIKDDAASELFKIQLRCVSNSELYIKRDIIERIDDTKEHQQIANNIGDFLKTTYDRYDWMVVAFTSHFSKDLWTILRRHILSGFTEVERGTVTVAVAHQIKGKNYAKAKEIKEHFKTCLKDDKPCKQVEASIQDCFDASEVVTATHIFKKHDQSYVSFYAEENDEYSERFMKFVETNDAIYTGKCDLNANDFIVLLKSNEEIEDTYKPCDKKNDPCKNKSECVIAKDTKIPLCKCRSHYHGIYCENKFEA